MLHRVKMIAQAVAPAPIRRAWGAVYGRAKIARARRAFSNARGGPSFLSADALDDLMRRGYVEPETIRYDPEGLVVRAAEKVAQISSRVPLDRIRSCVELGSWDGMVLASLRKRGLKAYGADLSLEGIDDRARAAGVQFVASDAAALPLATGSVDLVYSFAAFEHFRDPGLVLAESWRVLRPRGYLYLMFGPVYTSPYGLHAYRQIPVPYCQYLFTPEDLTTYADREGLPRAWPFVNGVSVTTYRELWRRQEQRFESLYYREHPTGGVGAELIARYPSCFREKVPAFGDLLVAAIEICLRKR
jgi:SAM-dependent methyltransferase